MKIDPRQILGPTTESTRFDTDKTAGSSTRPAQPAATTDRVSISGDVQLASAAMKAAEEATDVRPEEVERARKLLERGEIGNDLDALASKILDSIIKP